RALTTSRDLPLTRPRTNGCISLHTLQVWHLPCYVPPRSSSPRAGRGSVAWVGRYGSSAMVTPPSPCRPISPPPPARFSPGLAATSPPPPGARRRRAPPPPPPPARLGRRRGRSVEGPLARVGLLPPRLSPVPCLRPHRRHPGALALLPPPRPPRRGRR